MNIAKRRLSGRVALITGSSRGIGAAIAQKLARDGAHVVLHGAQPSQQLDATAQAIFDQGDRADIVTGDLVDGDEAVRVVRDAFAIHGALDILVLNAGGGSSGKAIDMTRETLDRILDLNLRSPMLQTAEFGRLTKSDHGRVIYISSGVAAHAAHGATALAAAKAGGEAFMRSTAQELGERGITLNSVSPGTTETDRIAGQTWTQRVPPWTALRRLGTPQDIADIVAFVASDEARWLTGATLPANGGLVTTAANILAYGG